MECMCRTTGTQFVWNSATRDSVGGLQRSCGSSDADGISQALHPHELSLRMALEMMTEARCSFEHKNFHAIEHTAKGVKTHHCLLKMEHGQFSFRRVDGCTACPQPMACGKFTEVLFSSALSSRQFCSTGKAAAHYFCDRATDQTSLVSSASTVKCLCIKETAGQDLGVVRDLNIFMLLFMCGSVLPDSHNARSMFTFIRASRPLSLSFCYRQTWCSTAE